VFFILKNETISTSIMHPSLPIVLLASKTAPVIGNDVFQGKRAALTVCPHRQAALSIDWLQKPPGGKHWLSRAG
jgi:hypothetical protein